LFALIRIHSRQNALLGWAAATSLTLLAACVPPQVQTPAAPSQPPRLAAEAAVMEDGYRLPLWRWGNPDRPRGLVLALHGFNDYGNAFAGLGDYLGAQNFLVYAVDQRGFGTTAQRGRWPGEERLVADLLALVDLLRERHPGLPITLVGESMGGAVLLAAAPRLGDVQGLVLIAPAVWSRDTMPAYQRLLLAAAARTLPGLELTGRGLGIRPTDNDPFWRAYSADPLVIKATRVDALWGVANLMDQATRTLPNPTLPILLLYGERDQVIPKHAFCAWLSRLPSGTPGLRLVVYGKGWHMLTRDRQGAWVMADIAAWIRDPSAPMPSGEELETDWVRVQGLCPKG
jgi:alpha-beta hydrolase superfamily lysophospholipase